MQFKKRSSSRAAARFINLFLCALLIASVANIGQAQSGRRIPKRPPTTEPPPPKESEPPIESSKPKDDKPQIPVLVVKYLPDVHSSNIMTNIALQGCLERLRESGAVKPSTGKDMNRKEASDAAKGSTETYAVLIQLEVDPFARNNPRATLGYDDPRYVYVTYEVFSPSTGKTKTSGRVYQRNRGPGGVPLPGPSSTSEYSLKYAGREAADRVLSALNLPLPPERRF